SAATASSSLLLVAGLLAAGAGAPARQTAEQPPPAAEPPAAAKAQPAKGDRLPAGAVARLGTTRWRHGAAVHDVVFSPDGKLIASNGELRHPGSPDSPIRLWDAATGRELWRLGDDSDWKGTPAFSPDGQRLFVPVAERGGKPGEVRIYDTATGRLVQSWPRRDTTTARSCALSPDGKVLAAPEARLFWTAEEKVPVVLLDATTGKELRRLEGHTGPTNCVAFSPDGKVLATGGSDKAVGLWDTATGRRLARLTDHATEVTAVALSPDGKYLAAASRGGVTLLWDLPAGRKPREVARQSMGGMVRFTPDGRLVAAGGQRTRLLEPATGKEVRRFPGVSSLVGSSLAVSPDGKALAASGEAGQIVFWDLASGKRLFQPEGHQRPVGSVALSPDGRVAASGSWDGTVRLWEVASGKGLRHLPFRDWGARVTFAADGSTLLTVGDDGMVRFWGAATGAERRRFPTEPRKDGPPVIASAVSADGRLAATSGRGHVIRLWDTATGRPAGAL
ncbi:MAG TPA: PQQ-binding-like beta-propeller repeat protein, partial [Gemmataceae bacterium]|nr:PQQ-binding-like beta-propeller repeat protein [Gemmataceae bacterium]